MCREGSDAKGRLADCKGAMRRLRRDDSEGVTRRQLKRRRGNYRRGDSQTANGSMCWEGATSWLLTGQRAYSERAMRQRGCRRGAMRREGDDAKGRRSDC